MRFWQRLRYVEGEREGEAAIDRGLAEGDGYTRDMIAVSFVEGMDHDPYYEQLRPFLGPRVSEEIVRQRNWRL